MNPAPIWVSNMRRGCGAALVLEHFQVLFGGMEHRQAITLQQLGQRGDGHFQRVDDGQLVLPGNLNQRHPGVVGALAVELGVEGVGVGGRGVGHPPPPACAER